MRRQAPTPLARLAELSRAAIVVVRHLNKSRRSSAIYRGGGSIGIIGQARAGLLVANDPDDAQAGAGGGEADLAEKPAALAFRLVHDELHDCASVVWLGATKHRANTCLLTLCRRHGAGWRHRGASRFLDEVLKVWGRLPGARRFREESKKAGASSWPTIQRAKARKGV